MQGVGFRPFIYNEATALKLNGYVQNTSYGVYIEVVCDEKTLNQFLENISTKLPKISKITNLYFEKIEYKEFNSFKIVHSETVNSKKALVQSDIAVCADCLNEFNDPANRRYKYFLINCTNCGPRYSIINTLPYDRKNTSMAKFQMCEACASEFDDVTNRRFHAQPISCETCGPKLSVDVDVVIDKIKNGKIIALKGLGGFHLICDAKNEDAIKILRERKSRATKPFALMYPNIEMIKSIYTVNESEEELLLSYNKPIVLIQTDKSPNELIAPNIDRIGLFLPYTPLHHLILDKFNSPIIATSANLGDEPIIRTSSDIEKSLYGIADLVVDFDRDIINSIDDSIMQVVANKNITLRLARGFTPKSFKLKKPLKRKVLAVGANQKNSIALAFEDIVIMSGHIGDLNSIEAFEYFERTVETFKRFYDFEPDLIVCDKHPEYETTKWAKKQKCEVVQIQHHYAHTLACMFEHQIETEVLSFAFDGTGAGDDGTIWGGEVFLADKNSYNRVHHLKQFKLLGSQKAIKESKRVALSLLFDSFSIDEVLELDNASVKSFSKDEIESLHVAWQRSINSPLTSSFGRVFDAISSLVGISHVSSYEGESALMIEKYYDENIKDKFSYKVVDDEIDLSSMIKEIVTIKNRRQIVSMFINSVVDVICTISRNYRQMPIVVTGGVFQNRVLLEELMKSEISGRLIFQEETPINDGSIALGQIYSQM